MRVLLEFDPNLGIFTYWLSCLLRVLLECGSYSRAGLFQGFTVLRIEMAPLVTYYTFLFALLQCSKAASSKEEGISSSSIGGNFLFVMVHWFNFEFCVREKKFCGGSPVGRRAGGRVRNVKWHCSSSWCLDFSFALNSIAMAHSSVII